MKESLTSIYMNDLEHARLLIEKEDFNLVIVKEGEILFSSQKAGIYPLFDATSRLKHRFVGATVGDKIVGAAAAMLCLYAQVSSVYAVIISESAKSWLQQGNINLRYKNIVPNILNHEGTDICPFEKIALDCQEPAELFLALQRKFAAI